MPEVFIIYAIGWFLSLIYFSKRRRKDSNRRLYSEQDAVYYSLMWPIFICINILFFIFEDCPGYLVKFLRRNDSD